jgi:hypothetical protein
MAPTEVHRLNIEVATLRDRVAWLDTNARGTNTAVSELHEGIERLGEALVIIDARLTLVIDALDARLQPSEG